MHDTTVVREKLIQLVAAPAGAYVALFANVETRSVDQLEVHTFGVFDQIYSDGEKYRLGTVVMLDSQGTFAPVYQADNFLGVVDRMEMLDGMPEWVKVELETYLSCWDTRNDEIN